MHHSNVQPTHRLTDSGHAYTITGRGSMAHRNVLDLDVGERRHHSTHGLKDTLADRLRDTATAATKIFAGDDSTTRVLPYVGGGR